MTRPPHRGVQALEVLPDGVGEGVEAYGPGAELVGPGRFLARRARADRAGGDEGEFEVRGDSPAYCPRRALASPPTDAARGGLLPGLCAGDFLQQRVEKLRVAVVVEADLRAGHASGVQAVAGAGVSGVEALEVLCVRGGFLDAVKERGELAGGQVGLSGGGEGASCGPLVGVHERLP